MSEEVTRGRILVSCVNCVMDTTDRDIWFNDEGVCRYCLSHQGRLSPAQQSIVHSSRQLDKYLDRVRTDGAGSRYDCVVGLSGGVDSSYLALLLMQFDIRPLLVHVDAGWNSEIAVGNIEAILDHTGFDLETLVVDWPSMRDLQLAYFRSGVLALDMPQDHAFIVGVQRVARQYGIRWNFTGWNSATESVLPMSWTWNMRDVQNMRDIATQFGGAMPSRYPLMRSSEYLSYRLNRFRRLDPLEYVDYVKDEAISRLETVGWRPYPRKHGESKFTAIYQDYILPVRWGIDKRKPHLSSLILAGQLTRSEAEATLARPAHDGLDVPNELSFLARKLEVTDADLLSLVHGPRREHLDFSHGYWFERALSRTRALRAKLTS